MDTLANQRKREGSESYSEGITTKVKTDEGDREKTKEPRRRGSQNKEMNHHCHAAEPKLETESLTSETKDEHKELGL